MKPYMPVFALVLSLAPLEAVAGESPAPKPVKVAMTCFSTGEQVSGMNKICYYDCLGSATAITIKSIELCPMSINR